MNLFCSLHVGKSRFDCFSREYQGCCFITPRSETLLSFFHSHQRSQGRLSISSVLQDQQRLRRVDDFHHQQDNLHLYKLENQSILNTRTFNVPIKGLLATEEAGSDVGLISFTAGKDES